MEPPLAGEITQVLDAIPWVRCASGNVLMPSFIPGESGEKASGAGVNALGVARYCNECQMNTKHGGNTFEKPSFWRKYSDFPHFN